MLQALINGTLCGLLLSLLIGPVFFALIQTSVDKGFRAGFLLAVGILISDSLYIAITYLGISQFLENGSFKMGLGIGGGIILVIMGVYTFFKKGTRKKVENDETPQRRGLFRYIIKGFLLNGVNPFVFLYWIGIVSLTLNSGYSRYGTIIFFASINLTVFTTDLLKAYLANKLRHFVTEKFQLTLNKLVGTGLVVFGVRLIFLTFLGRI